MEAGNTIRASPPPVEAGSAVVGARHGSGCCVIHGSKVCDLKSVFVSHVPWRRSIGKGTRA